MHLATGSIYTDRTQRVGAAQASLFCPHSKLASKPAVSIRSKEFSMETMSPISTINRVAVIGNYLPRRCGIATFTTDLTEALTAQQPRCSFFALPVNDIDEGYNYPAPVRFEITEQEIDSYSRAADFLNIANTDVVSLQHEFGIYGGPAGSHILTLLETLRMPVITTLHTILRNPDAKQRRVMTDLTRLSSRMVVMSERGRDFLSEIYRVPSEKIDLIPHGVHDTHFVDPNFHKDQFGVEGRTVLLTFGLLSQNKGIENVINALPNIIAKHPEVVYLVLGATHPNVKRHEGETYRLALQQLAQAKGVADHVIFHNRFVDTAELMQFIGAADVYLTPYLNAEQIVSGTLAYTVGAGKAVISTPYWHAEELLADGRGAIVPFRDPDAIAEQVLELLDNDVKRHAMRKRAYQHGRSMTWQETAQRYMESFERARAERSHGQQTTFRLKPLAQRPRELPLLKLDHLHHMTDSCGILQHATFAIPNYAEGYCTDDNARALIIAVMLEEMGTSREGEARLLGSRYIAFLNHAFNSESGRFRNFMSFDRRWLEDVGSDDSHGRALWSLGAVLGRSRDVSLRGIAGRLFERALPAALETCCPRSWAYALLGIGDYLRRFEGDRTAFQMTDILGNRLLALYRKNAAPDWQWFEDKLTYANALLPHALLISGRALGNDAMIDDALDALSWLAVQQQSDKGEFSPIGSSGFYPRGGERAQFDQQPIEAHTSVLAYLEAYRINGEARWLNNAWRTFNWFLGENDLVQPMYNPLTGGCRDGMRPDQLNPNEGAESTLAFLHSLLEMRQLQAEMRTRQIEPREQTREPAFG
jgi:glycosyltransferase involved in cell wall biosynthesis